MLLWQKFGISEINDGVVEITKVSDCKAVFDCVCGLMDIAEVLMFYCRVYANSSEIDCLNVFADINHILALSLSVIQAGDKKFSRVSENSTDGRKIIDQEDIEAKRDLRDLDNVRFNLMFLQAKMHILSSILQQNIQISEQDQEIGVAIIVNLLVKLKVEQSGIELDMDLIDIYP